MYHYNAETALEETAGRRAIAASGEIARHDIAHEHGPEKPSGSIRNSRTIWRALEEIQKLARSILEKIRRRKKQIA